MPYDNMTGKETLEMFLLVALLLAAGGALYGLAVGAYMLVRWLL